LLSILLAFVTGPSGFCKIRAQAFRVFGPKKTLLAGRKEEKMNEFHGIAHKKKWSIGTDSWIAARLAALAIPVKGNQKNFGGSNTLPCQTPARRKSRPAQPSAPFGKNGICLFPAGGTMPHPAPPSFF
jgi:hypothetical protein